VYNVLEFVLIIVFTFFYTALLFNAQELSDQLKKSGGFIGGIRPGKQTADYFDYVLTRIAVIGALYLGTLAVLPNILMANLRIPLMLSGTSLLIVVGVALELAAQIESYLIEHKYEGFLSSGRIKSRIMR
jgi:preprotein translocase subunit SecY